MVRDPRSRGDEGDFGKEAFVTDEATALKHYTYADRIKDKLEEIGLGVASKPSLEEEHKGIYPDLEPGDYFNGRLPTVIRSLSLDQLSALYSLFSSWYGYLVSQTNFIAAGRSEALRQKEFLWSHLRKQYKTYEGKKQTDANAGDLAKVDYRFIKANAKYEELNVLYECMNQALEVTKQDMKVISREVTIVQTKLEAEAKNQGMHGRMDRRSFKNFRGQREEDEDAQTPEQQPPPRRIVGRRS